MSSRADGGTQPPARNYPRPRHRGSGADGCEDGAEGRGPGRQARGVDDGAHGGFALSRPHRPIAVGHLALNDGWSQGALTGIVRDLDPTGIIQEGQELIAGPADLGLEGPVRSQELAVVRMPARCRSSVRRLAASVEAARFVTRFASAKTASSQICRRHGTGR